MGKTNHGNVEYVKRKSASVEGLEGPNTRSPFQRCKPAGICGGKPKRSLGGTQEREKESQRKVRTGRQGWGIDVYFHWECRPRREMLGGTVHWGGDWGPKEGKKGKTTSSERKWELTKRGEEH